MKGMTNERWEKPCDPLSVGDGGLKDGLDLSQIDWLLSLTPAERLKVHDDFMELVRALREAGIKHYGRDPRPSQEAA
jgi:hypothetical protein